MIRVFAHSKSISIVVDSYSKNSKVTWFKLFRLMEKYSNTHVAYLWVEHSAQTSDYGICLSFTGCKSGV